MTSIKNFYKKFRRVDSMDLYFPFMLIIGTFGGSVTALLTYLGVISNNSSETPTELYIIGIICFICCPIFIYLTVRDINKVNID